MRILILNWRDIKHPLAGGAEISTHEHAKRWVREGNEVFQFSSRVANRDLEENIDGINIIRRGNHYTVHLHAFIYYLKNFRNRIDLIIDEFHFIPFLAPFYARTKVIAFIHETAKDLWFKNQPFPVNILGFLLEPLFFKFYKRIPFITVSDSSRKDLIKFGIDEKNIYVIHNGISTINSDSKKEKDPTIIYLGRLAKDKGVEDAIMAFSEVQEKINNAKMWIIGREEKKGYYKNLVNLVKRLKIDEKITFYGYVSEEKKFDLLKRSWALVHPSFKEGWGLTVIEGASCGTPSVAYNVEGLCDSILDKKTGLLVNKKKPEDLSDALILLLRDKSLYLKLSKGAVEWSKKFNWSESTKKSFTLIKKNV